MTGCAICEGSQWVCENQRRLIMDHATMEAMRLATEARERAKREADEDLARDVYRAAQEAGQRELPLDLTELEQRITDAPSEELPRHLEAQRDAWQKRLTERDKANGRL